MSPSDGIVELGGYGLTGTPGTEATYEGSGLAPYDPYVHGRPKPVDHGVTRIAGVGWLDSALCAFDDDPDAWQLDPTEVIGDPPVLVKLSGHELLRVEHARTACALCPVAAECLSLAQESETVPVGIWAGLDWAQRGGLAIHDEAARSMGRRSTETPEQKAARLGAQRASNAAKLAMETEAQRKARRDARKARDARRKARVAQ